MYPKILSLLLREHWAIDPSYALAAQSVLDSMLNGEKTDLNQFAGSENFMTSIVAPSGYVMDLEDMDPENDKIAENSVAVIGVSGVMQKFGGLCSDGTEQLAAMLSATLAIKNVSGAVMRFHSPGGTVSSIIPLKRAMTEKRKPVVSLVDSMAGSAAYYIASMADVVMAVDALAEIGSIGAMATIINNEKQMEDRGIKRISIYAPQSSYKNKPIEDVLAGKEGSQDAYASEVLAPIAENFIQHVKAYRKGKLDESMEGLLSGKMFYANEALKGGLIDQIGTMEVALETVRKLAIRNSIINSIN